MYAARLHISCGEVIKMDKNSEKNNVSKKTTEPNSRKNTALRLARTKTTRRKTTRTATANKYPSGRAFDPAVRIFANY